MFEQFMHMNVIVAHFKSIMEAYLSAAKYEGSACGTEKYGDVSVKST
jgi:hypothetical protein